MVDPSPPPGPLRTVFERIAEPLELVERCMHEQLVSESQLIPTIGNHVLSSGGKRVRPSLVVLTSELCGYTGPRRVQIAAALELLHTATLLHDDVIDLGIMRRGRPTANALWGERRAVLVGDFLLARASSMVVEDGNLDILWLFSNTIRRMAEGEILQLQQSFDPEVTEAHYFAIVERKSADLLSAACEAGAILGGVTRAESRRMAEFGRELGIAFQLRDDALDYIAGEDVLGKQPLTDLREGKVTLPLLLTYKRCDAAERQQIADLLKLAAEQADRAFPGDDTNEAVLTPAQLAPAVDAVARHRGVEDTMRRAREHVKRAVAAVAPFPHGTAKDSLLEIAEFTVSRDR